MEAVIKWELKPRIEVKEDKRKEVMNCGIDNAYPTRMERVINGFGYRQAMRHDVFPFSCG